MRDISNYPLARIISRKSKRVLHGRWWRNGRGHSLLKFDSYPPSVFHLHAPPLFRAKITGGETLHARDTRRAKRKSGKSCGRPGFTPSNLVSLVSPRGREGDRRRKLEPGSRRLGYLQGCKRASGIGQASRRKAVRDG